MACTCRFYGFKNFINGISDLEKLTGNEMRHISSVLYLLLDGVCEDDSNRTIAKGTCVCVCVCACVCVCVRACLCVCVCGFFSCRVSST